MATPVASSTTATTTGVPTSLGAPPNTTALTSNTITDTTNTAATTGTGTTSTKKDPKEKVPPQAPKLSANELERVTEVFKMYETGLREATIYPKVGSFYNAHYLPAEE